MRILVIGASKGIGLETVKLGLEHGHTMRAFARSADSMELEYPALERHPGDATHPADLAAALIGVDAVVMALGVPKNAAMLYKKVTLFSEATAALIPAMQDAGVLRLLAVTGFGAGASYAKVSLAEKLPFKLVLGHAYKDKDRQEALIKDSPLDWTIVRPTILTSGPRTGTYKVLTQPSEWRNGVISRANVADFLIGEAESGAHVRGEVVLAQ